MPASKDLSAQPLSGKVFAQLQRLTGAPTLAISYFTGLPPNKLSQLRAAADNELPPRYALLLRYLLSRPEKVPTMPSPDPTKFFAKLKAIRPKLTDEHCVRLLGYQPNAALRLAKMDPNNIPHTIKCLMMLIEQEIEADPNNIDIFLEIAEEEARARGQDPLEMWNTGWRRLDRDKD